PSREDGRGTDPDLGKFVSAPRPRPVRRSCAEVFYAEDVHDHSPPSKSSSEPNQLLEMLRVGDERRCALVEPRAPALTAARAISGELNGAPTRFGPPGPSNPAPASPSISDQRDAVYVSCGLPVQARQYGNEEQVLDTLASNSLDDAMFDRKPARSGQPPIPRMSAS